MPIQLVVAEIACAFLGIVLGGTATKAGGFLLLCSLGLFGVWMGWRAYEKLNGRRGRDQED